MHLYNDASVIFNVYADVYDRLDENPSDYQTDKFSNLRCPKYRNHSINDLADSVLPHAGISLNFISSAH